MRTAFFRLILVTTFAFTTGPPGFFFSAFAVRKTRTAPPEGAPLLVIDVGCSPLAFCILFSSCFYCEDNAVYRRQFRR
jgi:hypothetical protein